MQNHGDAGNYSLYVAGFGRANSTATITIYSVAFYVGGDGTINNDENVVYIKTCGGGASSFSANDLPIDIAVNTDAPTSSARCYAPVSGPVNAGDIISVAYFRECTAADTIGDLYYTGWLVVYS